MRLGTGAFSGAAGDPPALRLRGASVKRYGDVAAMKLPGGALLAVACDSLGAIGPKPQDRVPAPAYVVGRFTCRVPLMELVALGAEPFLVVCALCVEPEPTGGGIMAGVRDEVAQAGLDPGAALLGSTEKNVPTSQTGLGVFALGTLARPRWGRGRPGDLVCAVGLPRVGAGVALEDPAIADIPTLRLALACPGVGDAVPVGSRGIAAEAEGLAHRSGCGFAPGAAGALDLCASAGPATCFLVTAAPAALSLLQRALAPWGRPVTPVGLLVEALGRGGPGPKGRSQAGVEGGGGR
ncbi:MAG: hypothetical protein K6T75_06375 [Acetobacteraceae bacterium]|nr:hypothetical protein [Acetobacteraceae bacterium]